LLGQVEAVSAAYRTFLVAIIDGQGHGSGRWLQNPRESLQQAGFPGSVTAGNEDYLIRSPLMGFSFNQDTSIRRDSYILERNAEPSMPSIPKGREQSIKLS
jgi:hypothetical protein